MPNIITNHAITYTNFAQMAPGGAENTPHITNK